MTKYKVIWKDKELGYTIISASNVIEAQAQVRRRFGYYEDEIDIIEV